MKKQGFISLISVFIMISALLADDKGIAQSFYQNKKYSQCEKTCQKILKENINSVSKEDLSSIYILLGSSQSAQWKTNESVTSFSNAYKNATTDNSREKALQYLAKSYYITRKYYNAESVYDALLNDFTSSSNYPEYLYYSAKSMKNVGKKNYSEKLKQILINYKKSKFALPAREEIPESEK